MGDYRKLIVWQKAKDLAVNIYQISGQGKLSKDFGLKYQICRSSVSIAANIAEGEQLDTNHQAIRHFYIARGSAAELQTHLIIANEIGYIGNDELSLFTHEIDDISSKLTRLIQARQSKSAK